MEEAHLPLLIILIRILSFNWLIILFRLFVIRTHRRVNLHLSHYLIEAVVEEIAVLDDVLVFAVVDLGDLDEYVVRLLNDGGGDIWSDVILWEWGANDLDDVCVGALAVL